MRVEIITTSVATTQPEATVTVSFPSKKERDAHKHNEEYVKEFSWEEHVRLEHSPKTLTTNVSSDSSEANFEPVRKFAKVDESSSSKGFSVQSQLPWNDMHQKNPSCFWITDLQDLHSIVAGAASHQMKVIVMNVPQQTPWNTSKPPKNGDESNDSRESSACVYKVIICPKSFTVADIPDTELNKVPVAKVRDPMMYNRITCEGNYKSIHPILDKTSAQSAQVLSGSVLPSASSTCILSTPSTFTESMVPVQQQIISLQGQSGLTPGISLHGQPVDMSELMQHTDQTVPSTVTQNVVMNIQGKDFLLIPAQQGTVHPAVTTTCISSSTVSPIVSTGEKTYLRPKPTLKKAEQESSWSQRARSKYLKPAAKTLFRTKKKSVFEKVTNIPAPLGNAGKLRHQSPDSTVDCVSARYTASANVFHSVPASTSATVTPAITKRGCLSNSAEQSQTVLLSHQTSVDQTTEGAEITNLHTNSMSSPFEIKKEKPSPDKAITVYSDSSSEINSPTAVACTERGTDADTDNQTTWVVVNVDGCNVISQQKHTDQNKMPGTSVESTNLEGSPVSGINSEASPSAPVKESTTAIGSRSSVSKPAKSDVIGGSKNSSRKTSTPVRFLRIKTEPE
ncbi:uncharacterized protein LOC100376028 [Saccoglossus kowalevskii]|uniref:Flocculation protein FLO11-like n=1 Tax=Saccoglossus kowalevskii TaxID=10224 RepID=A0ABM0MKZ5_SACKO|nr:PREDICTED: flocculation protein FLO11-like [Saccoglossus kowalevskii]